MGPQLVELGRRAAMGRPIDTSLRSTATGTAETRQPERDLAEHGRNPMGPIVLDLAEGGAGPAFRPPSGMVPALRPNHRLLDLSQQLSAVRQRQSQSRKVAQITRADDLQYVDAAARTIDSGFHQAQNPPHPYSPAAETYDRSYPVQPSSPNLAAVPRSCYFIALPQIAAA